MQRQLCGIVSTKFISDTGDETYWLSNIIVVLSTVYQDDRRVPTISSGPVCTSSPKGMPKPHEGHA